MQLLACLDACTQPAGVPCVPSQFQWQCSSLLIIDRLFLGVKIGDLSALNSRRRWTALSSDSDTVIDARHSSVTAVEPTGVVAEPINGQSSINSNITASNMAAEYLTRPRNEL